MPAYPQPGGPYAVRPGDYAYFWGKVPQFADQALAAESIAAGGKSQAFNLPEGTNVGAQRNVSIEINFSGAPGAFEIDVQVADTDTDAAYIQDSGAAFVINAVNANNWARTELLVNAKYIRLYMKNLTNAVNVIAKLSR